MDYTLLFIHGYESKYYAGPLRPFINWAEYIIKKYPGIYFYSIFYKTDPRILEGISSKLKERIIFVNSYKELVEIIKRISPDTILSDDYLPRLAIIKKLSKKFPKIKTITYVQFLFGVHAISSCFSYKQILHRERMLYKLSFLIPYKIFSLKYVNCLKSCDFFIANSRISKNLFFWLYNTPVKEVIYPPVNTDVFKPRSKKDNVITIYLGSSGGDINLKFLLKLLQHIIKKEVRVVLFGNNNVWKIVKKKFGKVDKIKYYEKLNDEELSKLYSESIVTICPQLWELFGYVAVESMAHGTPVLAFNYFGHAETVINKKTGLLANTEKEFLNNLGLILEGQCTFDYNYIREHIIKNFSIEVSTNKLIKIINDILNCHG